MPIRREVKPNRQLTFPIDSSQPPRLPPSEVCQRGPPSLGGSRHAAPRIEKPSGNRTFAAICSYDCTADKAPVRCIGTKVGFRSDDQIVPVATKLQCHWFCKAELSPSALTIAKPDGAETSDIEAPAGFAAVGNLYEEIASSDRFET